MCDRHRDALKAAGASYEDETVDTRGAARRKLPVLVRDDGRVITEPALAESHVRRLATGPGDSTLKFDINPSVNVAIPPRSRGA